MTLNSTKDIDWPGIRANAQHIGIREAARQAAQNLPLIEQTRFVFRVLKRAAREHWTKPVQRKALVTSEKPLSSNVLNGEQIAKQSIADTGREIRTHLARIALASAKRTKRVPLRTMKDLRDAAAATQLVDPQGDASAGVITLNVLNVRGDMHTRA